ncbi:PREDICTED: uncharacterized protein LOC104774076 [Camelina sativa]|uniref:Uncharacterized protein LOC104774076 n=1 Tax=Camelina sativa TaxID=90675 RepID=A0ABM0Y858_CAMSA|nr:PREDICTED: uncharacterized protein LOC104774076 [Camelina sativa]
MGWFYLGCKKCSKKVEGNKKKETSFLTKPRKPTFWCPKCNLNITQVVPRFKLHVSVIDQTGEMKCMLFDGSASEIVGQTAHDLLDGVYDDDLQDPSNLPLALKNLVGKTFQLLVLVEIDNLYGGNETYRVGKIWPGTEGVKIDDLDDSEGQGNPSQIISGDQDILLLTNSSETSASDFSTPSSKRVRENDEGNSTNKKIMGKSIMFEKQDEKVMKLKAVKLEKIEEQKGVKIVKTEGGKPNENLSHEVDNGDTKESEYAAN